MHIHTLGTRREIRGTNTLKLFGYFGYLIAFRTKDTPTRLLCLSFSTELSYFFQKKTKSLNVLNLDIRFI